MRVRMLYCTIVLALGFTSARSEDADARQAEVRLRGSMVMPFALAHTQHVFETTPDGGVQRVLARAGHVDQIPAIRSHLAEIAAKFQARDFGDPETIHGVDMPGLALLRAAPTEALHTFYRELQEGAEVRYVGTDPQTIAAIHAWFAAQLADHGQDATGHAHHHEH